ncbi:MAG TPA: D-alanine--D-alanine ligase family protein [Bryobacteraceae bacterium]|nr:D-alanine--D-alanine ligase family protein [Bryobacteraceae bacterium]
MNKLNVAVLYGGRSGEHEVSLRSAESIIAALDPERYQVTRFLISKEGRWDPKPLSPEPDGNPGIDVVFPVLHGTFGEDGTMQGLLELADLPYVGPGVLASSAAMDKEVTKRLCVQAGLPVVEYRVVRDGHYDISELETLFGYPMFVKPANLGSSVGISKAKDRAGLEAAIVEAARYDRKVIVERSIVGQEIECSVLGNADPQASTPCEVLPFKDFYDYEDKYLLDKTEFRIPAGVGERRMDEIRRLAVACFKAVGCEGMSRVDFLIEKASGQIFINEINTIPGFTSISMYPKMWAHDGLPYSKLLDRLIELAMERHAAKRKLKFTR